MARIYAQEVGKLVTLDTGIDLSTASSVKIRARPPVGAEVELTAAVVETTKVRHTKAVDTLAIAGKWKLQPVALFSGGTEEYRGAIVELDVEDGI